MNCSRCHHFDRFKPDSAEGVCLAHPPTASVIMVRGGPDGFRPENFTAFPTLNEGQTCGEWTAAHARLIIPN